MLLGSGVQWTDTVDLDFDIKEEKRKGKRSGTHWGFICLALHYSIPSTSESKVGEQGSDIALHT